MVFYSAEDCFSAAVAATKQKQNWEARVAIVAETKASNLHENK